MGFAGFSLTQAAGELTSRRVAVAVIAVERFRRAHGDLPPSLDALVPAFITAVPEDPFSGKPLLFRKEADGYVVYSVDLNRRDDHGTLTGHGSGAERNLAAQLRDLGIRVPLGNTRSGGAKK
jgi:hypothetical protein